MSRDRLKLNRNHRGAIFTLSSHYRLCTRWHCSVYRISLAGRYTMYEFPCRVWTCPRLRRIPPVRDRPPRDLHVSLLCFGDAQGTWSDLGWIRKWGRRGRRRRNVLKSDYAYSYIVTCRRIFISSIVHTQRQKMFIFSLRIFQRRGCSFIAHNFYEWQNKHTVYVRKGSLGIGWVFIYYFSFMTRLYCWI